MHARSDDAEAEWRSRVAALLPVVGMLGGVFYFAGFLTVLFHTSAIGLPVVEVAQPRYFLIGLPPTLLLGLFLLAGLLAWLGAGRITALRPIASVLSMEPDHPANVSLRKLAGWTIYGVVVSAGGVVLVTRTEGLSRVQHSVALIVWFLLSASFIALSLAGNLRTSRSPFLRFHRMLGIVLIVSGGVIGVQAYARDVYPALPVHAAGGRPVPVRLILDTDTFSSSVLAELGLLPNDSEAPEASPEGSSVLTPPILLLYTTADLYLVAKDAPTVAPAGEGTQTWNAVALRKDAVAGLSTAPH